MEEALQENVGHTDQVVVLLSLVEGVAAMTVALVVLYLLRRKRKKKGEELKDTHYLFYFFHFGWTSLLYHHLGAFLPVSVMVSHIHQFVFQLLNGPNLGPLPFSSHLDGWFAHYCAMLYLR